MIEVVFAKAFQRHVACPSGAYGADGVGTVRDVFDAYFADHPAVRGYVLDEAGAVRRHVAVFVGDELVSDRAGLGDPVRDGDRIHVFQALSGGAT